MYMVQCTCMYMYVCTCTTYMHVLYMYISASLSLPPSLSPSLPPLPMCVGTVRGVCACEQHTAESSHLLGPRQIRESFGADEGALCGETYMYIHV